MRDVALDWLVDINFDGVPGVPGVPAQFSATFHGTPRLKGGVPGVPAEAVEHLGTPLEHLPRSANILKIDKEHLGTPGTPKNNDVRDISAEFLAGIEYLKTGPRPPIDPRDDWAAIITQAEYLAVSGWAGRAIALGWSPLEVFGVSPRIGAYPEKYGLTIWLGKRRVACLDARSVVATINGERHMFTRFDATGNVLLWELGR